MATFEGMISMLVVKQSQRSQNTYFGMTQLFHISSVSIFMLLLFVVVDDFGFPTFVAD